MNARAPHGILLVLLCCGVASAAISDLRHRRIPNLLVSSMAVAGFLHAAVSGGLGAVLASLFGACVGTALLLWAFVRGLLGGGDVKLLGAVGAWVGPWGVVHVFLLGTVLGGVLGLVHLVLLERSQRAEVRRKLTAFARSGELAVPRPEQLNRARGIPYGVALAAAAALVLVSGAR